MVVEPAGGDGDETRRHDCSADAEGDGSDDLVLAVEVLRVRAVRQSCGRPLTTPEVGVGRALGQVDHAAVGDAGGVGELPVDPLGEEAPQLAPGDQRNGADPEGGDQHGDDEQPCSQ
jgi:hypothetical protein